MTDMDQVAGSKRTEMRPNLFIVGAMKCGTTILFDFLTSHQRIIGGAEKELHFFSLFYDKGEEWYLRKFPDQQDGKYFLDASPTYFDMCLDLPTAERIKDFSPDAKIIILIRNPVQRSVSHFLHLKKINKIAILDGVSFDDMVERNWPDNKDFRELEEIRSILVQFSLYEKKIQKFVDTFGSDNVIVVTNDDLRNHGDSVVGEIFDFIDLGVPENSEFSRQNYLNGSESVEISQKSYFKLLKELGDDYYRACRLVNVTKPKNTRDTSLNQPVGALVGDVGIGEDGWLFLAGGSNNVLNMYMESEDAQRSLCARWHEVVRKRAQKLSTMNAQYFHVMVPEKITLLGEKLHWPIDKRKSRGIAFNSSVPSDIKHNVIDLIQYFLTLEKLEQYYFSTDSHWNFLGAFVAYQLIFASLGFQTRKELLWRPRNEGELVLDLGVKLPDAPKERVFFSRVREQAQIVDDRGLVRYKRENGLENEGTLHVGSFIEFENNSALIKKRIMIFGDSFSEYRDHLLTALFAESFQSTVFIWSTNIDYAACERFKPDLVFCIMTERFMDRLPEDQFDHLAYAEKALQSRHDK